MQNGRSVLVAASALLCIAGQARTAASQDWVEVNSPNFTVASDAGEGRARDIAWQFEQFRGAMETAWPWARVRLDRPVVVIAARDERSMQRLLPAYWEGDRDVRPASALMTAPDRHYIAIRSDVRADDNATMNPYLTAYWSYAMLMLRTAFRGELPLWFSIGMAEVMSNTVVRENELRFGLLIPWHLERLQEGRLRLRDLVEVTSASPQYTDGASRRRFDAQCWAVVHYLLFGRPNELAGRVNDLVAQLVDGKPSVTAVEAAFGSVEALETGYMQYAQQRLFRYVRMKTDGGASSRSLPARALQPHDSAAIRAALYVATNRPVEARAAIADARKAGAAAVGSYEAEAMLLDREGTRDDARAMFAKATDLGSTNAYVFYRLALLTWGPDVSDETLGRMETLLGRSVEINDAYGPAHTLLSNVLERRGQTEPAIQEATKASRLEPREPGPRVALARALWRAGRRDDARAHALAARALANTDQQRADVQQLLDFFEKAMASSPANP